MTATFKTSRIAQNLFAYGASEVAAKASRLLVVVVVARSLDLTQIGVAAAALAAADILKALTENGVGQKIISAPGRRVATDLRHRAPHFLDLVCGTFSGASRHWICALRRRREP